MNLLESIDRLNEKQKEAVLTTQGPLLIAAGAGSGKTRVLTHRIAYLVEEEKVNPWNILAITFTNKAANEMKERIKALVGPDADSIWVSTFHSMCVRILRREGEKIGYQRNFSIVDQSEQLTLMRQVLKELNLDSKQFKEKSLLWQIEQAKNQGKSPKDSLQEASNFIEEIQAKVYQLYQSKLKQSNAMDFNDLILNTVKLLEDYEEVRLFYQHKFQYIHVDEYQDTNNTQYLLIRLLTGILNNICVVGDADQSIYGWRGANMENILNFESDFPQAKTILLEQNYRSSQNILAAANSVIKNNNNRKVKKLWSQKDKGSKIKFYHSDNDSEEARFVIQEIIELKDRFKLKNDDFAILYRTQAQSRSLEDQLLKANLPYKIIGGLKFYSRKEIQDTLAYLRLINNPADNLSFNRIINVPKRGIGNTSVERLAVFADQIQLPWLKAIDHLDQSQISRSIQNKLKTFAQMIKNLQQQAQYLSMGELVEQVWELSGYTQALLEEGTIESQARLENLEEFASVTKLFDEEEHTLTSESDPDFQKQDLKIIEIQEEQTISEANIALDLYEEHFPSEDEIVETSDLLTYFLTELSLVSDNQEHDEQVGVTLMTLHAAKGLEFPVVFIVGMEEGIFPSYRSFDKEEDLEEERRLAYVGMTRAEKMLYLTAASNRLLYGRYQQNLVSRFVDEVEPELIERIGLAGRVNKFTSKHSAKHQANKVKLRPSSAPVQKKRAGLAGQNTTSQDLIKWQVGDKVDHKAWGQGTIVKVETSNNDQILKVAFPEQGIKQLMAAFAPITKSIE
ncbi:UvrD-helicase domain-containing protein [Facklamia miroungae]|uniref:ATP-dependent DNA helicase PcrA n=1 Tax=Facklamia miroungae TaxID=120956 RepID=A0A1G7TG95_9LACT|nr:UvrD-helicase domain-containing protein [Facklamia miroungae]NKZ29844.1 UvrD-helicase domain-containing protein [Facklamia miroungae]SDG34366.1 DNA helicase-2 / ATP-dependent DNA helicase PcrA [Facklamia miroungae]